MKKNSYFLILFVMILLTGCSSGSINSKTNDPIITIDSKTDNQNKVTDLDQTKIEEEPKKKQDLNSLVPEGWGILNKDEPIIAEGDLNKDGIKDLALIIEQLESKTDEAPFRSLLIAFGVGEDTYNLSIIADNVILKADEGGVWGDPFESLFIDRGSVVISNYGGSNWRWYNKYRFRFQDNEWFLIGATMREYFTGNATQEEANEQDYNLLTGDYIIKKPNENGKIITEHGNRGKRELVKLKDFSNENINF